MTAHDGDERFGICFFCGEPDAEQRSVTFVDPLSVEIEYAHADCVREYHKLCQERSLIPPPSGWDF